MSTLSPDQWSALSPYLDRALTLSEAERAGWMKAVFDSISPALAAAQIALAECYL